MSVSARDLYQKLNGVGVPAGAAPSGIAEIQAAITALQTEIAAVRALAKEGRAPNTEVWIMESGTYVAPVAGIYEVLVVSGGGAGSCSNYWATQGNGGRREFGYLTLAEGEEVPVVIGAGSPDAPDGSVGPSGITGGDSSFGSIATTATSYYRPSVGLVDDKTALVSTLKPNGLVKTPDIYDKSNWGPGTGGVGGGSSYYRLGGSAGGVRLRYYDPAKDTPTDNSSQNPSEGG